ncbi:MAG: class I SAM-dependent rRNA methyltransferase [Planctomycetota bacterium]|jgi:23S rRNA (cytosine1962-C5)-methyltransferase
MRSVFLGGGKPPRSPRIFRKRVRRTDPGIEPGEVVALRATDGTFLGRALYSPRSVIAARVLDREEHGPPIDDAWFAARIGAAAELRERLGIPACTNSWRMVHAEGDGLSGLVIDKYDDLHVVELSSRGMFERLDAIESALSGRPGRIVVRADEAIQKVEGFSVRDRHAEPARAVVREHGLEYEIDGRGGHKTGFFLDQREARRRVAELARGRRVLDLCCYTGGFALNAARGGARSVLGVDLDEWAVAEAAANADRNGLAAAFEHADVFDFLRSGPDADLIVLDPPKLAKSPRDLPRARRKSVDFNRLAIEALPPGGLLFTFSCTGLFAAIDFFHQVREAAHHAGRSVRVLERTSQPCDHPVDVDCPESSYLNGLLLAVG